MSVTAVWKDTEQAAFMQVLDSFTDSTGIPVDYQYLPPETFGDELIAQIDQRTGPDIALLPQPALLRRLAGCGLLKALPDDAEEAVRANYNDYWQQFGRVNDVAYGVPYKATNKSTVWYDAAVFAERGIEPPQTWDAFVATLQQLADEGIRPLSIGVANGSSWALTDWFESVYLQMAGADAYDRLTRHDMEWTDPSVVEALNTLGSVWQPKFLAADPTALNWQESVARVFRYEEGAVVYQPDFAGDLITRSGWGVVGDDARFFPFPAVRPGPTSVVTGGDTAVLLSSESNAAELMAYLASADAAEIWARRGGFISPNQDTDPDAYPNDTARRAAQDLLDAEVVRFDLSDQQAVEFGSTPGTGLQGSLQDLLLRPEDAARIAVELEAKADRADASSGEQPCSGTS